MQTPIEKIKTEFDALPAAETIAVGEVLGKGPGENVGAKLLLGYKAAHKVIAGLVKGGNPVVDASALAIVRDAIVDFHEAPSTSGTLKVLQSLGEIFDNLEYAPPARTRSL